MNRFNNLDKIFHIGVLVFFALMGSYLIYDAKYGDKFFPGVYIAGEKMSGQSYEEALVYFKTKSDVFFENGINISFSGEKGTRGVNIPMFSDGLTADVSVEYFSIGDLEGAIKEAYDWGHSGSFFERLSEQARIIFFKKDFSLPAVFHDSAIASLLERELDSFLEAPKPAEFKPEGSEIIIVDERPGEAIDEGFLAAALREKLASLDSSQIEISAEKKNPRVSSEALKPFLGLANQMAKETSLVFVYKNRKWKVDGGKFVSWLTVKEDGELGVESAKLEAYLSASVGPLINNPPRNSRFEIRDGKFVEISPGAPGNVIDIKKTAERVERIIPRVDRSYAKTGNLFLALQNIAEEEKIIFEGGVINIPIEIIRAEPRVTQESISQYKIKDLVGYARTSFAGSSKDRINNIKVGVSKLTGLLLAPGEEFSAVKAIGSVTEADGYVKEYVIKDNKSVKELGGGLCQIATTLFRLALDSGFKITARTEHRYVVKYYGPGLDATVYSPQPDLRFINNTDNFVLLQGSVKGTDLIFEFYGTEDGRSVSISEPRISNEKPPAETKYIDSPELPKGTTECSETPRKGMTAEVTYTVTKLDGSSETQIFKSVYQPWGKICLVGTGS